MTSDSPETPESPTLEETRETLLDLARGAFGKIPVDRLVDHVLRHTPGADFAVRRAALEALERRWRFAKRDGLAVASRPDGGGVLGEYATSRGGARRPGKSGGRRRREPRPYTSVLESVDPFAGDCDCPDYLRSSLGLCKHLLVVLDDLHGTKGRPRIAAPKRPTPRRRPWLVWDPGIPLNGSGDRLLGLELRAAEASTGRISALVTRVEGLFRQGPIDPRKIASPKGRRDVLDALDTAIGKKHGIDASPAVRALVREELERATRRVDNASAARATLKHVRSLRRKLYPYQTEGLTRFLETGRLLLADDMGLGKTTQAVAAAHVLFESGRVRRGLLVVPAALKGQWLREWEQTSRVPCAVVDGRPDERARQYRSLDAGFLIVGYEQLLRDIEHVQRLAPELVVLDEAQRIKNYATKSAVYVKSLDAEYRLVLTGTPMENRLEELASILDWVDDLALAPKWRLVPWYTLWEGDGDRGGKAGARNLDTLRARLAPSVVRRVRKDVLSQLPSRTDTRVPVEMTPQQRAEHDERDEPIRVLIATSKRRPLTQPEFLRLMSLLTQQRIISNGLGQLRFDELWPAYDPAEPDPALLEGLFAPKVTELRRLIEDLVIEQGRKVVVFSQWRRMLRLAEWSLRDILGRVGARPVFFTGAERPAQRTRSIVDFHDDPRVPIMFLSDAGGVGLNLQRAANACINLELPWNPAVLEQRIGRIYRLGQKDPIDVYHLVSEYGIEARIASVVGTKKALFSGLFDGTSDQIQFDSGASFLTSVEKLLQIDEMPEPPTLGADATEDEDEADAPEAPVAEALPAERAVADELPVGAAPSDGEAARPGPSRRDDSERSSATASLAAQPSPGALLGSLKMARTADGGIRIEAPPEAAEQLVELFAGMAKLIGAAVAPSAGEGSGH